MFPINDLKLSKVDLSFNRNLTLVIELEWINIYLIKIMDKTIKFPLPLRVNGFFPLKRKMFSCKIGSVMKTGDSFILNFDILISQFFHILSVVQVVWIKLLFAWRRLIYQKAFHAVWKKIVFKCQSRDWIK